MVWDAHVGRKLPLIKKIGKKNELFKRPSDLGSWEKTLQMQESSPTFLLMHQ